MIDYVQNKVEEGTYDRQHPREFGDYNNALVMSRLDREGVQIVPWKGADPGGEQALIAAATGGRSLTRSIVMPAVPRRREKRDLSADIEMFRTSIDENRILPGTPNNAFSVLNQLRRQLPKQEYLEQSNQLRIALEMQGQQVLLSYLKGEQEPQKRDDFLAGAAFFEQAKVLTPESLLLDARSAFCLGRVAIFDKDYPRAEYLLERAARLDPTGAYSLNALGIAYLERANYDRAVAAFQDAVRLAPRWAYPYHNLALSQVQVGDFRRAIETYRQAIAAAPEFAYLPYNLGLLYQQLNRTRDAEKSYREAIAKADSLPAGIRERHLALAHNALGFLKASDKRPREAEELYRQALSHDEALLEARHNLAVLLAGGKAGGDRFDEAAGLWRENLAKDADYLPSRLSLARALNEHGRAADAAAEYREVVRIQPDYIAARLALAALERGAGNTDAALEQLAAAKKLQPENPQVHEEIGDTEMARKNPDAAMLAYREALSRVHDKKDRKRVESKMKR
jgi:tetratricopeptide (TPR) repeat protein